MQGAGFRCLRSFFFLTYHLWGPRLCRVRIALAKKGNTAYVKFKVYKVYKKGLQSRSATASLLIKSNSIMEEKLKLLIDLTLEVDTLCAPVGGNRDASWCFLRREFTWILAQWERKCCSSWISSVSYRVWKLFYRVTDKAISQNLRLLGCICKTCIKTEIVVVIPR